MKQPLEAARMASGVKSSDRRDSHPSIELQDVTLRFEGKTVLNGFSLTVGVGEKVLLTGPSGGGKTTILRCVLGFVTPDEGYIRIFGRILDGRTVWSLRTLIGYVPQEPELGSGTVKEWLEMPFNFRANRAIKKNLDNIPQLFQQFLLPIDLMGKRVENLSGGEKQRIAIVSAILLDRPILLMDEPTSALDDISRKKLAEYLSDAQETILMVSHEPALLSVACRVIKVE